MAIYPELEDFVSSTAGARVNGYVAGYGTLQGLKSELDRLGLSAEASKRLLRMVGPREQYTGGAAFGKKAPPTSLLRLREGAGQFPLRRIISRP
ncbi:MAG: hypothetical protein HY788_12910 [Deltaproteobacteria bacterium]|nr:hypothetical protein [Deltaproteobacteria bacterium]